MSKHTPEPWFSDSEHVGSSVSARLNDGWFAAKCLGPDRVENARRIASCVNACAGMEDPEVEIGKLIEQRDELLSSMNEIYEMLIHEPDGVIASSKAEEMARFAIAVQKELSK